MERIDFCKGWEFSRDGGAFEPVVVPHDAMLGAKRGPDAPAASASGYYHGCSFRYRKAFELDEARACDRLFLEFEGVYRDAVLAVNGTPVEVPPYGFVPFLVELTGLVHAGSNLVEVAGGNDEQPDCRWYSGAGIYRQVWLWQRDAGTEPDAVCAGSGDACIAPGELRIRTLSADPPAVRIEAGRALSRLAVRILDDAGETLAEGVGAPLELEVPRARPWDAEHPQMYRCVAELSDGQGLLDRAELRFGIRTLEWSARGLFVNGKETLLRGGCIHCDNGILGAASFPESERRRMRLLKQAGFNAVRIAHNPAPHALLDACDELGLYVMEETWDTWYARKSVHDYARHFLDRCDRDLRCIVAHAFNHPSVIMYSIGNELTEPIAHEGLSIERELVELVHALDPTRPVTCGFNLTMMAMEHAGRGWYGQATGVSEAVGEAGAPRGSLLFNLSAQAVGSSMTLLSAAPGVDRLVSPALDALDIAGYNYATARYRIDARKHPERIVVGSETFPHELPRSWELVKAVPSLIGDFMWTAWDYLGEAGAGAWTYTAEEAGFSKPWPWLLAGSGAIDILGEANAHAALAGAVWGIADAPSIQVRPVNRMSGKTYKATWRGSDAVPSWSWAGCEGTIAQVEVYDSRAASIRLLLNGALVGQKRPEGYTAVFKVEYQPGTLTALCLDASGHELARASLVSARGPLHLALLPEAKRFVAGSIAYVSVNIAGSNGAVESNADERLDARVEGGVLLGFGSAQPAPTERFLSGSYTSYRGRAQAVVYRESPGTAILHVAGESIPHASVQLEFA